MSSSLLTKLLHYVLITSKMYNIDSSHGLAHSMNILHFTKDIYDTEVLLKPVLKDHERLIFVSAILHDMCDKKYMKEEDGLNDIETFLQKKIEPWEMNAVKNIISTMSYSKVKKHGFPDLGEFQDAFNVVREADLLSAYDFDRCMSFRMTKSICSAEEAFEEACALFEKRIFRHDADGLLLTQYAKQNHLHLQYGSMQQIARWRKVIRIVGLK